MLFSLHPIRVDSKSHLRWVFKQALSYPEISAKDFCYFTDNNSVLQLIILKFYDKIKVEACKYPAKGETGFVRIFRLSQKTDSGAGPDGRLPIVPPGKNSKDPVFSDGYPYQRLGDKKLILSIGMIVKNEEKYLRRCLEALKPILQNLESELIIVDTGSEDNTVKIAREFTNNVFYFEWCNDFAAARNAALKRAKGRWYMSIDADEVIVDPSELIEFFNSGEYLDYNSASYNIRSANDENLQESADFNALRLIKLTKDSHYINPVHEFFSSIKTPIKILSVIADHYGYINEKNEEFLKKKAKKYLDIMLAQLDKKPNDYFLYINICNSYKTLSEPENVLKYSEIGLTYAKKEKSMPAECALYALKISANIILKNYEEAIQICDEYFHSKKGKLGTDLEIYYYKGESCFLAKKYREAVTSYKEYLNFYKEYKKGMHRTRDTFTHALSYTNDTAYRFAVLRLANAYLEEEDYQNARKYLRSIEVKDFCKDRGYILVWLNLEMDLMKKKDDFSDITLLYKQLDEPFDEKFQMLIERTLKDKKYKDLILKEFAVSHYAKTNYHHLMKLRYDYANGLLDLNLIKDLFSNINEATPVYADAFHLAALKGLPLSEIISKIDAYDIEKIFFKNDFYNFEGLTSLFHEHYKNDVSSLDLNMKTWISFLYFNELISEPSDIEPLSEIFGAYSKIIYPVLSSLFRKEILTDEKAFLLPKAFRTGYYCYMAVKESENGKKSLYIKYLRFALKVCPELKDLVKFLIDKIQKEMEQASRKKQEFDEYAIKVKAAIKGMIQNGQIKEATAVLQSYEQLCPDDIEITEIKNIINSF